MIIRDRKPYTKEVVFTPLTPMAFAIKWKTKERISHGLGLTRLEHIAFEAYHR
jgi:hypothetical protein